MIRFEVILSSSLNLDEGAADPRGRRIGDSLNKMSIINPFSNKNLRVIIMWGAIPKLFHIRSFTFVHSGEMEAHSARP